MLLRSFKLLFATLFAALLGVACGGDSAPAPTNVVALAGESSVTVSWDVVPGVEYWVFAVPTSLAPTDTKKMESWIGLPGGASRLNGICDGGIFSSLALCWNRPHLTHRSRA